MIDAVLRRVRAFRHQSGHRSDVGGRVLSKVHLALGENLTIVEAGAHNGSDTARLSQYFRSGTIHAFEPVPQLFSTMVERTGSLQNVHRYNVALAAKSGAAALHLSGGTSDGSSSLLTPKEHLNFHPSVTFDDALPVRCLSLDDWAVSEKITKVDFIWFDLQGMEADVLKASSKILPTVRMIYSEVSLIELYEGCPLYYEYSDWLGSFGFKVIFEDLAWRDAGNVLFAR